MSPLGFGPTVRVLADQCAGSGACRRVAPEVFGADGRGWVVLLDPHPAAERLDQVLDAQDACPLAVIEVVDENGDPLG